MGATALDTDLSALDIPREKCQRRSLISDAGKVARATGQPGQSNMLPEQKRFIGFRRAVPEAIDNSIAHGTGRGGCIRRSLEVGGCVRIIAGKRPELVLIAIKEQGDIAEIGGEVLDLRTIDQFLPLQKTANQQPDDD